MRASAAKRDLDDAHEHAGEADDVREDCSIAFWVHYVGANEDVEHRPHHPVVKEAEVPRDHLSPVELQQDHEEAKDDVPHIAHDVEDLYINEPPIDEIIGRVLVNKNEV